MDRSWWALALLVAHAAAFSEHARAEAFGPFAQEPEVSRLDNGLTVITVPWPSPSIIAYYTLVRVGARDEVEKGHSGFAHLFEHMMFRGTERFPAEEYERRLQAFGADNNAYTTQDFTLYTVTAPKSALADVAQLEADRFQHLAFDEATFRTETGAVLGEYNKSASSPFLRMWEALSELAYKQHTYGHTTIGYLDDVKAMPSKYQYARAFFRRFYTPDNSVVIVAGDVAHAEVLALVKEQYGAWKGARDNPKIPVEPEPQGGLRRHLVWDGTSSPQMLIGYRGPAFEAGASDADKARSLLDTAALEVVHGLLFDASAPLYQRLVVDEPRLLGFSSWPQNFSRDPGLFVVTAELKPETRFEDVERLVQEALDEVARGATEVSRIEAVRSHLRYALTLNVETASDAADTLAQFIALTADTRALARYLDALQRVTPVDVQRVAKQYLTAARRISVTLAPKPSPVKP